MVKPFFKGRAFSRPVSISGFNVFLKEQLAFGFHAIRVFRIGGTFVKQRNIQYNVGVKFQGLTRSLDYKIAKQ